MKKNFLIWACSRTGFPGSSVVKNMPANAEDMDSQSLGQKDPLEKEIATHSSILALEIPWPDVPGGLQSMGLQNSWTLHNS